MSDTRKLEITEQRRAELKLEFNQLETIEEKLDFWKEKLKTDFCFFDRYSSMDIDDFMIRTDIEDEIEYINNRNLNVYKEKSRFINSKNRFPDFAERVESFNQNIEKALNKDFFINEEIRKLDLIISQKEQENALHTFHKSRFFCETYRQYIENSTIQAWNSFIHELGNLIEVDQGLTIAKYKLFLQEYRTPKRKEQKKNYSFSHDQQIFILDYLGFHKDLDNVKRGKLYGAIINRDSETTRQRFSSIEKRKTITNLNPILSYFTELGFKEQIQLVKKDIDRKEQEKHNKQNKR